MVTESFLEFSFVVYAVIILSTKVFMLSLAHGLMQAPQPGQPLTL